MICPICRKEIKDGSKFCGKCGSQIPRCPGCGKVIYKRTRFCVYDGTPLPEELLNGLPEETTVTANDKGKTKKKSKIGKIIITVLLVIILLIVLLAAGIWGYVTVKGIPPFVAEYLGLDAEDEKQEEQEQVKEPEETEPIETEMPEEEDSEETATEEKAEVVEQEQKSAETAHFYEIIASDTSWEGARMECEYKGGYLATITSKEEYDIVCELAEESGLTYLWLGALRYSDTDRWGDGSWITGEDWTFDYWYPGEPSLEDLDGAKEYYLCLWNAKYEGNDIGWTFNDQRNDLVTALPAVSGSVGYICEYENEVNTI